MIIRTIEELVAIDTEDQIDDLISFVGERLNLPISNSQIVAWRGCIEFLKAQFNKKISLYSYYLIFEYPLTTGSLKRPDVLIVSETTIHVLEFKSDNKVVQSYFEQVVNYTRDIVHFHAVTQEKNLNVIPYIVLPNSNDIQESELLEVPLLTKDSFLKILNLENEKPMNKHKVINWMNSRYQCLPSIMDATLQLFESHELPNIKSIAEGEINETILFIKDLIKDNIKNNKGKRIIFLSGVPGSGKTLVVLKLLHDMARYFLDKYQKSLACYTSGNDSLINVLKSQLENIEFVNARGDVLLWPLKNLKNMYIQEKEIEFPNIFFDEAQRAWNIDEKRTKTSDPKFILKLGQKMHDKYGFANIICCIGEGQAIHKREEGDEKLWQEAFKDYPEWDIYSSNKLAQALFQDQFNIKPCEELQLDVSIRHNFIDTSKWIEAVLSVDVWRATIELRSLLKKGFIIRICRDLEIGRKFVEEWARNNGGNTYGYITSSKVDYKDNFHSEISSYVDLDKSARWFFEESKKWKIAASEFLCQGLEIDIPLLIFNGDYKLYNRKWEIPQKTKEKHKCDFEDFEKTMSNVYRVLLSRSRKAFVIYIPDNTELNETYNFFKQMGISTIEATELESK